jgi:hypothetical protein
MDTTGKEKKRSNTRIAMRGGVLGRMFVRMNLDKWISVEWLQCVIKNWLPYQVKEYIEQCQIRI